jgi:hypothetical protein
MAFKVVPSRKVIEQFIEKFVERKLKESRVEERINELRRVLGLDKKGAAKAVVAVPPAAPAPTPAPSPARVEVKHEAVPAPRAEPRREAAPAPEPKPSAPKATTLPPPAKKKAPGKKAAKKPVGPVKVPGAQAKASAVKPPAATKPPATTGPDPLTVVLAALDAHPKKAALIKAGKQKDQLLRSLIPLYVAQKVDVEVTSGVASKLWAKHGVTFAAPNAAKVLREHAGYAKRNAKGVLITPAGIKYVEDALAGNK